MNDDDMRALIARVEAAEGADRELDAEIATATTPGMIRDFEYVGFTGVGDMYPAPAYTASLDAAASLVPSGWHWNTGIDWSNANPPTVMGSAIVEHAAGLRSSLGGEAATPALALTAAALRARLAMQEGSDE